MDTLMRVFSNAFEKLDKIGSKTRPKSGVKCVQNRE